MGRNNSRRSMPILESLLDDCSSPKKHRTEKLGSASSLSFKSWEDVKTAFGWGEDALKQRKREMEIAIHLRPGVADYVNGFFGIGCI